MDSKYDREIDLNDENTVYYKILEEIKLESKILEVGCSTGYFTKILKEKFNCEVYGIEIDENAAKLAEKYCKDILIGDVEKINLSKTYEEKFFDTIIFADVLEHLKEPEKIIEQSRNILKDDGFLIISIPNITHASVALELLDGKWQYRPLGILDNTHLKFFTKQSFLNLLEEKGFCPLKIKRIIINPWDTEFKTPYSDYPREITSYIEKSNPEYNTYQYVIKAIKFNEKTEILKLNSKINKLEKEKFEFLSQIEDLEREKNEFLSQIENLEKEKKEFISQIEDLEKEKKEFISKLKTIENEKSMLNSKILEKEFIITEIHNSLFWKIITKYRNFIDKIFPQGTKLRKFYNLINLSLKTILNNGFKEFIIKSKKYIKKSNSSNFNDLPDIPGFKKNWEKLNFPVYENPKFSIIIPVYNKSLYTFNCLYSILKNTEIPYEVIVIDDNSNDDTEDMLKNIKNCIYFKNSENRGFIYSCNFGAEKAKGEYLIFLNNDTIVTKEWDKNIIKLFEKYNDAGIVGAKLIFPDGKLQEAGSIIFSDGSAWNYGKFDEPNKPEYSYIKKVDYCSGACIAIKRELFLKIDKFDEIYKPAYYEDTDLAMKVRQIGYNVYFQPFSIVYHFEGVSCGKDTSSGIKKYQDINKSKFYEKWKEILEKKHKSPDTPIYIARERDYKGIIFVVDHYVPTYDKDSGSLRMFSILILLSELGWKIVFWPDNLAKLEPYTSELQWNGIEVIYGNRNYIDYIKENGKYFDFAFLSRPHIAKNYINHLKTYSNAKIIYDTVDLHFLREARRAKVENDPEVLKEAENWKKIEYYLCANSDIVIAITENEKEILKRDFSDKKIEVIPNIHKPHIRIKSFEDRKNIMFIGSFLHPPNIDAVIWFVNDIFPIIKNKLPDIKFYIIGSEPTDEVKKLATDDIIVTGYVKDVSPYFENCRVFVSPLRFGAGLKGKIGHSMSYGLPVVTTSIGAEGFIIDDEYPFIIADDEETFAQKVIDVYSNKQLWEKLSIAGIETIKKYYSPESIKRVLESIFND